jgi:hypothetical protein
VIRLSPARRDARLAAEEVIAFARRRGLTARTTRRLLREAGALSPVSASTWHAAACDAAGCLLLDLPDFRQPTLLDRGPRRRRSRKKTTAR